MIFNSSQHWSTDAMQWALNADRLQEGFKESIQQPTDNELTARSAVASPIFASQSIENTMQQQLNTELARVEAM